MAAELAAAVTGAALLAPSGSSTHESSSQSSSPAAAAIAAHGALPQRATSKPYWAASRMRARPSGRRAATSGPRCFGRAPRRVALYRQRGGGPRAQPLFFDATSEAHKDRVAPLSVHARVAWSRC